MRGIILWSSAVLLVVASARAQSSRPVTSGTLDINLRNADCLNVQSDTILVVVNGRDDDAVPASRTADKCRWRVHEETLHFRPEDVYTVRLRGARTDCRHGEGQKDEQSHRDIVSVVFDRFKYVKALDVVITPSPSALTVHYARLLPAPVCIQELGEISGAASTIYDVRFHSDARLTEILRLAIHPPNGGALGFRVNDSSVIADAEKGGRHRKLDSDQIADAIRSQRLRVALNWSDLDAQRLRAAVDSIDIRVK